MIKINKKYILVNLAALLICFVMQQIDAKSGITYSLSGGRFGDNLQSYCHARWLAYILGLEFYYRPFDYSNELAMHEIHQFRVDNHTKKQEIGIRNAKLLKELVKQDDGEVLYMGAPTFDYNNINWDNRGFIYSLREEIKCLGPLEKIEIPDNHMSIALHLRRGGGPDRRLCQADTIRAYKEPCVDKIYPRRFAPDTYYIECLRYILRRFPDQLLYVHIFTDSTKPDLIADKFQKAINDPRVVFGYRKTGNTHNKNVLDDFFALMNFDCLIRPVSGFSKIAGALGRVKYEIHPFGFRWDGDVLTITHAKILERDNGELWKTHRKTWYMEKIMEKI